jgi:hypothetical protein
VPSSTRSAASTRYALERRAWAEASELPLHPQSLSWGKFAQAESINAFARGLGAACGGNVPAAKKEVARLESLAYALTTAKSAYWAEQSEIQKLAVNAWIARAEGKNDEALALMRQAADREDATEKHPVTRALAEFEASQKTDPNRLHGLAGAARAAEASGDKTTAKLYYTRLIELTKMADSERPEITKAKAFMSSN